MLKKLKRLIYYVKSFFVPYFVRVYNGPTSAVYALIVYRTKNGDWHGCYATQDYDDIFSNKICEVIVQSKYEAMVKTYEILKNEYRYDIY